MHTKSTNKSQYFAFKTITRRLDDEKAERDFYFSEDFSFIHIVYSKSRMSRLKSMIQQVWNIIIIIINKNEFNVILIITNRLIKIHRYIFCIAEKEEKTIKKTARLLINHVWKLHNLSSTIVSDRESQFILFV
jgi:hypothetical protein